MGSLFVQYGTKAGGVSYIYNFSDWTAYSGGNATAVNIATCDQNTYDENTPSNNTARQVQTRTRTGSTYSYDCSYYYACAGNCSAYSCSYDCSYYSYCCGNYCTSCTTSTCYSTSYGSWSSYSEGCYSSYSSCINTWATSTRDVQCYLISGACFGGTSRYQYRTRSISTSSYSCQSCSSSYCCGSYCYVSQTCNTTCYSYCSSCCSCYQSQTCTGCNWSGWSAWSDTSSCTASSPGCSNGAVQRECQSRTRECIRTEV